MRFSVGDFRAFALLILLGLGSQSTAAPESAAKAAEKLSPDQIELVLKTLEDPEQREQLMTTLRALAQSVEPDKGDQDVVSVKTAAAELVELLAARVEATTQSATRLLSAAQELPRWVESWMQELGNPTSRQRWLSIAGQLLIVLGAGFAAAVAVNVLISRMTKSLPGPDELTLLTRATRLTGYLLLDLVPVVAFAAVAYAVLTVVDPHQATRLVGVALINASILSRLVLTVSALLFAPERPRFRLWQLDDESAHYAHQWVKRLSVIGIYGFLGLQAALLLGLDPNDYQAMLRVLGLAIVGLLLVLIAQNREAVAKTIAPDRTAQTDEPARLSSMRLALARVWHLLASLYLIVVYLIWALQIEDGAQYVVKATFLTLLVLAVARLLNRGTNHLFDRGLELPADLQQQFPGLEQRLNRYFPLLRKILKLGISLVVILLLASAWGIDALPWVTEGSGKVLVGAALNILLILFFALLVWEIASGSIERYLAEPDESGGVRSRSPRMLTLLTVAKNALMVVLTVVAVLMILSELGVNIGPLLAGAGVVGLAIGFGSQRLVQDVINGAFILFQDLMSVGDVVKLGDKAGVVEALSIRTVRLRDLAGIVHTIPFSAIEGVSNLTKDFSFHVFDIGIAYREDVDAVIDLVKQIGEELRSDPEIGSLMLEPLEVFGLDAFGDSAIVIKGRIKTQPIKQWQVGRAFNRLVKKRFDENDIEIPFPHQTLYFGQDKDGGAPPAFVHLQSSQTYSDNAGTNRLEIR